MSTRRRQRPRPKPARLRRPQVDLLDTVLEDECGSCGEGPPLHECPKSKRACGHHCNHVWTHDACDWCGEEFGEDQ